MTMLQMVENERRLRDMTFFWRDCLDFRRRQMQKDKRERGRKTKVATAQKISRMLMVDPLCEETDCMTSRPSHRILGFILTT